MISVNKKLTSKGQNTVDIGKDTKMKTVTNKQKIIALSLLVPFSSLTFASGEGAIDYGKTAVGSRYVWGGSTWDPTNRKWGGPDCAGLVLKAWKYPVALPYKTPLKGKLYTGDMLLTQKHNLPWTNYKDFTLASRGDAFTYNNGKHGHTFLYLSDKNGVVSTLEAKGKSYGVGYFDRSTASLKAQRYVLQKKKGSIVKTPSRVNANRNETRNEEPRPAAANGNSNTTKKPIFGGSKHYVMKSGDTLKSIAKLHKVPVSHLEKLNARKIQRGLKVGDKIQIS